MIYHLKKPLYMDDSYCNFHLLIVFELLNICQVHIVTLSFLMILYKDGTESIFHSCLLFLYFHMKLECRLAHLLRF